MESSYISTCINSATLTLTVLALLLQQVATGSAGLTTCEASNNAVEGHKATITCHFPEPLTSSRKSFYIRRYDINNPHFHPDLAVTCHWDPFTSQYLCNANSGHYVDAGDFGTKVHLDILRSTKEDSGVYVCFGGEDDREHSCILNVKGSSINCTTSDTVTEGDPSSIDCHFNSDLSVTGDSFILVHKHNDDNEETVFSCNWRADQSVCVSLAEGYYLKSDVKERAVISIPHTKRHQAGRYTCRIVPSNRHVLEHHCNLHVKHTTITTTSTTTSTPSTVASTTTTTPTSTTVSYSGEGSLSSGHGCSWKGAYLHVIIMIIVARG